MREIPAIGTIIKLEKDGPFNGALEGKTGIVHRGSPYPDVVDLVFADGRQRNAPVKDMSLRGRTWRTFNCIEVNKLRRIAKLNS